ncbi:hypothetical protein PR202_ga17847 [Eleusine coracana subsp. coracana]|uniref:Uncharacterized protein n=1 Tax=Eleusine coracana subsp. coracana TaxID=191504 RepID=A0AAV5CRH7_ELECO|nr:hypothetical protein QOZ80_6AG0512450 [Eleusine coracana subsp. coracana]GJN00651.1 hypothetical protein PR202_ga17847 [Eleusine coracana subsp. coracana]
MQFRLPRRRAGAPPSRGGGRRKAMAVVRLGGDAGSGGGEGGRRKRLFVALRLRLRVRWLAAVYRRSLRRLRACYAEVLRDLVEGTALMGALRLPGGIDSAHAGAASFGPVATAGF